MIYSYEKEGYASLWMAKCDDYDVLDDYLSTIYLEENEVLGDFFTPSNAKRAFEDELREDFSSCEVFNQFEYDFGLVFDEDFREAGVYDHSTKDINTLFQNFSELSCIDANDIIKGEEQTTDISEIPPCNAAFVLYDFKYEGIVPKIEHENISVYFLGYVKC